MSDAINKAVAALEAITECDSAIEASWLIISSKWQMLAHEAIAALKAGQARAANPVGEIMDFNVTDQPGLESKLPVLYERYKGLPPGTKLYTQQARQDGMVLVPVEPTEAMIDALYNFIPEKYANKEGERKAYQSMLAAAQRESAAKEQDNAI